MGLAQDGAVDDALALAARALEDAPGATPSDQAALWYAISVARHIEGDNDRALHACEQCLALAGESGNAGWASNALSMRAMAAVRQGRMVFPEAVQTLGQPGVDEDAFAAGLDEDGGMAQGCQPHQPVTS